MGPDIKNHRKSASKNVAFAPDASIEFFLIKTHVRNGTIINADSWLLIFTLNLPSCGQQAGSCFQSKN